MGILYCIVSFVVLIIISNITHVEFLSNAIAPRVFLDSLNIMSFGDAFLSANDYQLGILLLTMVQSAYISKMVNKLSNENSTANKIAIYIGNVFLGCFLALMYKSFPADILSVIIEILPYILVFPTVIAIFIKAVVVVKRYGVFHVLIGWISFCVITMLIVTYTNIIGTIVLIVFFSALFLYMMYTSPLFLGVVAAVAPSFIVLLIFAFIESAVSIPEILFMVIVYLFSYPLTEFFSGMADRAIRNINESLPVIIDVVFFVFSIIMIGAWVIVVTI